MLSVALLREGVLQTSSSPSPQRFLALTIVLPVLGYFTKLTDAVTTNIS